MKIKTIEELKSKMREMAGLLIDQMDKVPASNIELAQFYLIQSRVCLNIAQSPKLLKKVFKQINDGEYILADFSAAKNK